MSDGNHGDDGISDAEFHSLWTRAEQQNRAHELKRRREEREREDAWQASFPDLDSLRTPHDLLAECQRIRRVLIEDFSDSAHRTVAHGDLVVRHLWDAMRSIGGSVPDQPIFADCSVTAALACRLLGDYRRRDALHRAVDDVTRWCEARNGDDAPGRSRQTDSGKGRSVSNNPSELVSDDGPLRMPRTEAERANNTPVGDMGGHSAEPPSDTEPLGEAEGMRWQEVAERLERLRLQGEPFTSQGKLAEVLGCSSATINKAIKNTPSLHPWAQRPDAAPRAQSLSGWKPGEAYTDVVTASRPQTRELNPEDEVAIREYLEREDLKPEERAFFNSLSTEDQLDFLDDPDKHRKILGRKP